MVVQKEENVTDDRTDYYLLLEFDRTLRDLNKCKTVSIDDISKLVKRIRTEQVLYSLYQYLEFIILEKYTEII